MACTLTLVVGDTNSLYAGQCDFQITYPYDDLATCSPKERATAMKGFSDKLAKELTNWRG